MKLTTIRHGIVYWLVLVVPAVFLFIPVTATAASPTHPNILLIIADDYSTDGSILYNTTNHGASLPPTPNIARLATNGILFRNAYSYPTCSPTRCTMLTGRYGFRTGIGYALESPAEPTLAGYERTIPEVLTSSQTGYRHAMFGKWHLSFNAEDPNTLGGFAHFSGGLHGAIANYYSWQKTINGVTENCSVYATRNVAEDTIDWIKSQPADTNWFCWMAFNASHTPYHRPPTNMCPTYAQLPPGQAQVDNNPRPYYEAITESMDTAIGWVMTNVNLSNTIVILMGDNGTLGYTTNDTGSILPIIQPPYNTNHAKGTLYEGGIRIPLIIAGAGVTNWPRECTNFVHTVDLYATILELAGVKLAQALPANMPIDSRSLVPLLQNPNAAPTRDWVLSENFSTTISTNRAGRCLRNQQYKVIEFQNGRSEFYDLLADPYETNNLLLATLTTNQITTLNELRQQLHALQNTPNINALNFVLGRPTLTADFINGTEFSLWKSLDVSGTWNQVSNAIISTGTNYVWLADPDTNRTRQFYRVSVPER